MTRTLKRQFRFGGPVVLILIALLSAGAISNQIRINAVDRHVAAQALEGQHARATQCRTFPVAIKLYTAAQRYGLITPRDLATYLAAAPQGCPPTRR